MGLLLSLSRKEEKCQATTGCCLVLVGRLLFLRNDSVSWIIQGDKVSGWTKNEAQVLAGACEYSLESHMGVGIEGQQG